MPICSGGSSYDPRGDGTFGADGGAHNVGPAEHPHQPADPSASRCAASTPVVRVVQGAKTRIRLQPTDRNGRLLTLAEPLSSSEGDAETVPSYRVEYLHQSSVIDLFSSPAGVPNCVTPFTEDDVPDFVGGVLYPSINHWVVTPDLAAPGWLPANSPAFDGMTVPAGAKFGYNLARHPTLAALFPVGANDVVRVNVNGVDETDVLVVVTADNLWWMSDDYGRAPWSPNYEPCEHTGDGGSSSGDVLADFERTIDVDFRKAFPVNSLYALPGVAAVSGQDLVYRWIVKHYTGSASYIYNKTGTLVDAERAIIEFPVTKTDFKYPGVYTSQLMIFSPDGEDLYHVTPYWVEVAGASHLTSISGPPTISEIRLRMRDECPEGNELLGDFEYNDTEIALAILDPINQFNATRPPFTRYTVDTFPREWRYYWVRASMGLLMRIVSRQQLRNHLDYSAGGISVNDKNKYELYLKFANQLLSEWEQFIVERKAQLNMSRGFGSLGSSYG